MSFYTEKDLQKLMDVYQKEAAAIKKRKEERRSRFLRRIEIVRSPKKKEFLVSADLQKAPLEIVIAEILHKTGLPYVNEDVSLDGEVTARFQKLPVLKAMNLLLNPHGFSARFKNGVLAIQNGVPKKSEPKAKKAAPPPQGGEGQSQGDGQSSEGGNAKPAVPPVSLEVPLRTLDAESAATELGNMFPVPSDGGGGLRVGKEKNRNTVVLVGSPDQVLRARRVLRRMDRKPVHVVIEVLVVSIKDNALEELSADLSKYAQKKFSNLATNFGVPGANALSFLFKNSNDTFDNNTFTRGLKPNERLTFEAALQVLYQKRLARLISRPYLATLSGREATLNITETRNIVVQKSDAGAAVFSTAPISSGVILKMTPVVLKSNKIEMNVNIEVSDFLAEGEANKDENKAATIMQVDSGQSIVIGGLVLHRRSASNAGLPWLRFIPILNAFVATQSLNESTTEVLFIVTPYLYKPGLKTPIPLEDLFQPDTRTRLLTPTERLDFNWHQAQDID